MRENDKNDVHELLDGQLEEVTGGGSYRVYFTCGECGLQFIQGLEEIASGMLGVCPSCGYRTGNWDNLEIIP